MILILKPTSACNFCCSFCSAKELKVKYAKKHVPQKIKDLIKKLNPDWMSITGGDPLMLDPEYYFEILETLGPGKEIALTTNLKAFYENPDKWTPLFKHPDVTICTSFQYGTGRLWDKNTPYTKDMFRKVMTLFKEKVGIMPQFIAVITNENYNQALDHLKLAKELNTACRLNRVLPVGGAVNEVLPYAKMIDLYYEVKNSDLINYYADLDSNQFGSCNINTNLLCENTIRTAWLKEDGEVEYGRCEDLLPSGMTKRDVNEPTLSQLPASLDPSTFINEKCISCELCRLCNACEANRYCNKKDPNHCEEMLKRMDKIKSLGWLL